MDFSGKIAVVTGGAQGIGRAYCTALLEIGMKVCVCDVKEETGKAFIESLSGDHRENAFFKKCDVTSFTELKDAFENAISKFGGLDLVVNNAGIYNEKDWRKMVEVNFVGVINGIKLAFQYMGIDNGGHGGIVINTASNRGLRSFDLAPIYCGTKHGIVGLTKSYGTDYHFKRSGITMNAVCPGSVETDMLQGFRELFPDKELTDKYVEVSVTPDYIAKALIKLLKDGKNGAIILADGDGTRYV